MVSLTAVKKITLQGPLGAYEMWNPNTVEQAKSTPDWPEWRAAIEKHIVQVELDGALPVPISWAKSQLKEGEKILPSLLTLRVKTNSDNGYFLTSNPIAMPGGGVIVTRN